MAIPLFEPDVPCNCCNCDWDMFMWPDEVEDPEMELPVFDWWKYKLMGELEELMRTQRLDKSEILQNVKKRNLLIEHDYNLVKQDMLRNRVAYVKTIPYSDQYGSSMLKSQYLKVLMSPQLGLKRQNPNLINDIYCLLGIIHHDVSSHLSLKIVDSLGF